MELLQAKQIRKSNLDKSRKNGISNDERNRNFVETKQENPNTSDEDEISFFLIPFPVPQLFLLIKWQKRNKTD